MRALGPWLAVVLAGASLACATPGGPAADRPGAIERPDQPADYDFLVGREHELAGRPREALAAYRRALAKDPDAALLHRKVAELLARNADPQAALAAAERAHELDPSDDGLRLFLGTLYRYQRDVEAAERVLRDDAGAPFDGEAALLLYGLYSDLGRLEDALALAQWMVRSDPTNLRGHFALARAYERLEQTDDAERALRTALEFQPDSLAVYGALARSRRQRGDREGEIEIHREVLTLHPHHHPTLVALADAEIALERWDDARATLTEIETRHPGDLRSVARLGYLLLEAKEYEAAAVRFERVLEANPDQHEVSYFLGLVRRRAGDYAGAAAALERVTSDHERWVDAQLQLASIDERREDYARALERAEALRVHAPSRQLDLYVATLRSKAGDFEGAVSFLHGLLAQSPGDPELLYNLGVLYGEAQRTEEALTYMQRVLEQSPDHPGALNYVGYSWAEKGRDLDRAEDMIVRALEQRPDDGYITDSLGWVYYMRALPLLEAGEFERGRALLERAIVELERAAELTGGDPVISEHLGDAYWRLDDHERALEFYEEALQLEPREGEQPELMEKLERLRRELGPR